MELPVMTTPDAPGSTSMGFRPTTDIRLTVTSLVVPSTWTDAVEPLLSWAKPPLMVMSDGPPVT